MLLGERLTLDDEQGKSIDLGAVGTVIAGRSHHDQQSVLRGHRAGDSLDVPGRKGEKLNVNADTAATAVAQAMGAEKLIYMSDVNGVRRKKDDPDSLINSLTASQAQQLIRDGAIESGMIPKVEACLDTLGRGVRKIHIIDGRERHGLLLEIYTNKGVGTEIVRDP